MIRSTVAPLPGDGAAPVGKFRWRHGPARLRSVFDMKKQAKIKAVWETPKLREVQIFFEVSLYTARR